MTATWPHDPGPQAAPTPGRIPPMPPQPPAQPPTVAEPADRPAVSAAPHATAVPGPVPGTGRGSMPGSAPNPMPGTSLGAMPGSVQGYAPGASTLGSSAPAAPSVPGPAGPSVQASHGPAVSVPPAPAGQLRQPAAPRPTAAAVSHAHDSVLCVNAPGLAASGPDGQLRGHGLHGFYRSGIRTLARMEIRLGGIEPLPLQGSLTSAATARFVGSVRIPGDPDPDPALTVERLRHADGAETITVRNSGLRPARLPLEIALGTDLGSLTDIAAGRRSADLPAQVQSSGLRWSGTGRSASVSARPSPHAVLAGAGVLRWDLEVQPGARWSVELRSELETAPAATRPPAGRGTGVPLPWAVPEVRCDDGRAERLLTRALDSLGGLLLADADRPTDLYAASGAPWRFGLTPADALWAARMTLPLGTRLAAGTLRALARRQQQAPTSATGPASAVTAAPAPPLAAATTPGTPGTQGTPGAAATAEGSAPTGQPANTPPAPESNGRIDGLIPGPLRHGGPELPPACTATEATLLFVTVLAEAWRWGLSRSEVAELLPAAERALGALRRAVGDGTDGPEGFVLDLSRTAEDRAARPTVARCEVQALAHRAALHGADLLDAFDRPGAGEWRAWATRLRERFRERFWIEDLSGGRPAAGLMTGERPLQAVASTFVHLLDLGLAGEGELHEGLLDRDQLRLLAQRLVAPELDCGWGLRTLSAKSPRFNPLGHRSGAVRVHETVLAITGLAEAGFEREAGALLEGLLEASAHFDGRLPEMYAGEQRAAGSPPVPHPASCRPAAMSAAAAVHVVLALAGVRPDVPASRVVTCPASTAPLGELQLTGLRIAGETFSVRVSRIGVAVVEEAPPALQLGTH